MVCRRSNPRNNANVTKAKTTATRRKKDFRVSGEPRALTSQNIGNQQTFDDTLRAVKIMKRSIGFEQLSEKESNNRDECTAE